MKPFIVEDWCRDPYAKECEMCETIVGRYGVMLDENGWRQIVWWPHRTWDGSDGSFRCKRHSLVMEQWKRLF